MKWRSLRKFVKIFLGLITVIVSTNAVGKESHQIGDDEHPWDQSGSFELISISNGSIQPLHFKPDENLLLGVLERGGKTFAVNRWCPVDALTFVNPRELNEMIDGDRGTAFVVGTPSPSENCAYWNEYFFDLGGAFPVNRIRFYPREEFSDHALPTFELSINDGNPRDVDHYKWPLPQVVVLAKRQRTTDVIADVEFPLRLVRYVGVDPVGLKVGTTWEIAEMEVYGEGYVPEASYTSHIIDLGGEASFGRISWSGRRDPDAKVWIQTRSGTDDDPNIYWRRTGVGDEVVNTTLSGEPLSAKDYSRLAIKERGPITYDMENWSFWSAPYDFEEGLGGVSIVSPGPCRYFQLRVDFISTITDGGGVDIMGFEYSTPPSAHQVVGEVWPVDVVAGEVVTFTYALRPRMREEDRGFDSLEILTSVGVDTVRAVMVNGVDVEFGFEVLADPARLVVHFPRMGVGDSGKVLEVVFDTSVLRYGTEFVGRVFDSGLDEVSQLVGPGNATLKIHSNDISVRTSLDVSLIASLGVSPVVFTPNGDGVNDEVVISYSLLKLTSPAYVLVEVYDLSGGLVRRVYSGKDSSGKYSHIWDGSDGDGEVVSPGIYIYRISVRADAGLDVRVGTVAVAY